MFYEICFTLDRTRENAYRSVGPVCEETFTQFYKVLSEHGDQAAAGLFPNWWEWQSEERRPIADALPSWVPGLVVRAPVFEAMLDSGMRFCDAAFTFSLGGRDYMWLSPLFANLRTRDIPSLYIDTDDCVLRCTESFKLWWESQKLCGCNFRPLDLYPAGTYPTLERVVAPASRAN